MAPVFQPPLAPAINVPTNPGFFTNVSGGQIGPAYAQGAQGCVGIQVADITLTSAQILALQTTPVTLIQAPGQAGFTINPMGIIIRLIGGSAAYTDVGGAVSFAIGSASFALASNAIFLTTTSPNRAIQRVWNYAVGTDTAGNPPTDDNAPLTITKATNNFAAGNGTCHLTVYYTIEQSI